MAEVSPRMLATIQIVSPTGQMTCVESTPSQIAQQDSSKVKTVPVALQLEDQGDIMSVMNNSMFVWLGAQKSSAMHFVFHSWWSLVEERHAGELGNETETESEDDCIAQSASSARQVEQAVSKPFNRYESSCASVPLVSPCLRALQTQGTLPFYSVTGAGSYDGLYEPLPSKVPMWKRRITDDWIFRSPQGRWIFGGDEENEEDFQCETGNIVSKNIWYLPDQGINKYPDEVDHGGWLMYDPDKEEYVMASLLRITDSSMSMSSSAEHPSPSRPSPKDALDQQRVNQLLDEIGRRANAPLSEKSQDKHKSPPREATVAERHRNDLLQVDMEDDDLRSRSSRYCSNGGYYDVEIDEHYDCEVMESPKAKDDLEANVLKRGSTTASEESNLLEENPSPESISSGERMHEPEEEDTALSQRDELSSVSNQPHPQLPRQEPEGTDLEDNPVIDNPQMAAPPVSSDHVRIEMQPRLSESTLESAATSMSASSMGSVEPLAQIAREASLQARSSNQNTPARPAPSHIGVQIARLSDAEAAPSNSARSLDSFDSDVTDVLRRDVSYIKPPPTGTGNSSMLSRGSSAREVAERTYNWCMWAMIGLLLPFVMILLILVVAKFAM